MSDSGKRDMDVSKPCDQSNRLVQAHIDTMLTSKDDTEHSRRNKKARVDPNQSEGKTPQELENSPPDVDVEKAAHKQPQSVQPDRLQTPKEDVDQQSLEGKTPEQATEALQGKDDLKNTSKKVDTSSCIPPPFPDAQQQEDTVEQGRVYFFYRPKVAVTEVKSIDDVQRFLMVMCPTSRPEAPARLVIIGKKRLPSPEKHERFFAFVEAVGKSMDELVGGLGEEHYETKTRGERVQPAAHALGEALYVITGHKRGSRVHTHMAYKLEVPQEPGEVQREFNINETGSLSLSIKNPKNKPPGVPSAGPEPDYSKEQKEEFKSYSWIPAEDPTFLDVAGTELLFIGAREGLAQEDSEAQQLEEAVHEDIEQREGGAEELVKEQVEVVEKAGGAVVGSEVEKGSF